MDWFTAWWEGLGLLGQIFATAAIPATAIMLLQTVLLLFGLIGTDGDGDVAGHHADVDSDTDVDGDGNGFELSDDGDVIDFDGLRLFTVRGIVAMLSIGGWVGAALCDVGVHNAVSIVGAVVAGLGALFLSAYIIKVSLKLQDNGNFNVKYAVAHTATVYIPIPPARTGTGKVTMNLQERFVELDALTDHGERLTTGMMVQIVSVTDKNEVIVIPVK